MRKNFYISALFVLFIASVACLLVISNRDTKPEIIYNPPTDEMMTNIRKNVKARQQFNPNGQTTSEKLKVTDTEATKQFSNIESDVENTDKTLPITESLTDNNTAKVSPHGFGPYPKLPDIWPKDYWDKERTRESELIGRVRIKLYNEGKWTEGATLDHDTGLVHPIYKDTVYVKWGTYTDLKGNTQRYITSAKGYPDTMELLNRAQHIKDMPRSKLILDHLGLTEQSLPPGIKFVTYEEGAIDPIEYLGLK